MKKYFIPAVKVMLATGIGCKKGRQENTPPTQPPAGKKWVVTTVARNGTASFVDGPVTTATFLFPGI